MCNPLIGIGSNTTLLFSFAKKVATHQLKYFDLEKNQETLSTKTNSKRFSLLAVKHFFRFKQ